MCITKKISAVLIIILAFMLFATSCDFSFLAGDNDNTGDADNTTDIEKNEDTGNNEGGDFNFLRGYCSYRSDTNEFDINEVTLEFLFGRKYYDDPERVQWSLENELNVPSFELYLIDEDGNEYLVRRAEENFVSEKYGCYIYNVTEGNVTYATRIRYSHSESITIPRELFTKERGRVRFEIRGKNILLEEKPELNLPDSEYITHLNIDYRIVGEKIVLDGNIGHSVFGNNVDIQKR